MDKVTHKEIVLDLKNADAMGHELDVLNSKAKALTNELKKASKLLSELISKPSIKTSDLNYDQLKNDAKRYKPDD